MTDIFSKLSGFLEQGLLDEIFPGCVLLCSIDQEIIFHRAAGMADRFSKRSMTQSSIFDLASLTKPLATSMAVINLVQENQLSLDDPIGTVLAPLCGTDKSGLTVDMLMRHTSGLPAYKEYFHSLSHIKQNPKAHLRQMLKDEPLIHAPGSVQEYSDLGFMILSWLIEAISGQPLDQYVMQNIYAPLDIGRLFYIPLHVKDQIMARYGHQIAATQKCPWREKLLTGEVDDDNAWAVGGVDGHAGLFGDALSVHAMCCEILNALRGRPTRFLQPHVIKEMTRHKGGFDMVAGFDTPSKKNSSAGNLFSKASVGHLGFTGTSFWIDPESRLIVVFLTNRVHPSRFNEKLKSFRPKLHNLICEQLL